MRDRSAEIGDHLDQLARDARPGDRLPTIRELMQRFGASQMVVQRAFQQLKSRGLIASQVGRGTYFLAEGAAAPVGMQPARARAAESAPTLRSVLLLRRSVSIVRGRMLIEGLQQRFSAEGQRVLEVAYTDPEHARSMLKGLPRFDACVVQSSFKTIPVELLAALRDKTDVLAVDGMALIGADVESVGVEWGEPLTRAVQRLQAHGHRRIACASTAQPFLATQLGWRRFEGLQREADMELQAIAVPHFPGAEYEAALVEALRVQQAKAAPCTALVAWGIEDGERFRAGLASIGLEVPAALSVVLLGRTDLVNEHADFFDTFGCSVADQVEGLYSAVHERWRDSARPYGVRLVPVAERAGRSLSTPAVGAPARARRSR